MRGVAGGAAIILAGRCMRYLLGDQWSDSFLDYYCGPDSYRIRVSAFANLEQLTGIYFVPLRSNKLHFNSFELAWLIAFNSSCACLILRPWSPFFMDNGSTCFRNEPSS